MERRDVIRRMNGHPWIVGLLLALAGVSLHFAVESWYKALAILIGAVLLDIAVDLAFTKAEEEAGEID